MPAAAERITQVRRRKPGEIAALENAVHFLGGNLRRALETVGRPGQILAKSAFLAQSFHAMAELYLEVLNQDERPPPVQPRTTQRKTRPARKRTTNRVGT